MVADNAESQSGTLGQVQKSRLSSGDPELRLYEPLESQVSAHGTCMLYVNAQHKVSLVNPLVPHFATCLTPSLVGSSFMLDVKWSKSRILWLSDRGS
jgi:hypothetical protein